MNALIPTKAAEIMEAVIARGDISKLTAKERGQYYVRVCESIGLNPMTRPFEYITLNNKLTLYARKDCTDQLRSMHKVSVTELASDERDGVFIVTAKVRDNDGRTDVATGAVYIDGLTGEAAANAMMKAETKAKRRATLSICGLGFLDESEVEDIPPEERQEPSPQEEPRMVASGNGSRPQAPNPNAPAPQTGDRPFTPQQSRAMKDDLLKDVENLDTKDACFKWASDSYLIKLRLLKEHRNDLDDAFAKKAAELAND